MFASASEYICAVWNGLMRPFGESMNTLSPRLPRIAYSAAEPVSPEVAPRMFSARPALRQRVLEQVAEQLQRDVLERQRRPTGEAQQVQPRLERRAPA